MSVIFPVTNTGILGTSSPSLVRVGAAPSLTAYVSKKYTGYSARRNNKLPPQADTSGETRLAVIASLTTALY